MILTDLSFVRNKFFPFSKRAENSENSCNLYISLFFREMQKFLKSSHFIEIYLKINVFKQDTKLFSLIFLIPVFLVFSLLFCKM